MVSNTMIGEYNFIEALARLWLADVTLQLLEEAKTDRKAEEAQANG